jgi:hypothetical protein
VAAFQVHQPLEDGDRLSVRGCRLSAQLRHPPFKQNLDTQDHRKSAKPTQQHSDGRRLLS